MDIKIEDYCLAANAKGSPSAFLFDRKTGVIHQYTEKANLILYSGADCLSSLLAGDERYAITTMYLEYKNGTGGAPIPAPVYDRTGGIAYYNTIVGADILRVPLAAVPTITTSGSDYLGNKATFFSISEGTVGEVNSLAFTTAADSAVYGAALVATRDPDDRSQDVIFSRVYFPTKLTKLAGLEVGVVWPVQFN